jgi:hypothetical protein
LILPAKDFENYRLLGGELGLRQRLAKGVLGNLDAQGERQIRQIGENIHPASAPIFADGQVAWMRAISSAVPRKPGNAFVMGVSPRR